MDAKQAADFLIGICMIYSDGSVHKEDQPFMDCADLIENQAAALKTAEELIAQKDADLAYLRGELAYASDGWSKSRDEVRQKDIQLAVMRGDLLQAGQREDEHMRQYNEMVAEYDNTIKTLREDVVQKNVTIGILLSERK